MISVNDILNKVHELGQPEQRPVNRLGATRIWGVACAALESVALLFAPWHIGVALKNCTVQTACAFMHELMPESAAFNSAGASSSSWQALKTASIGTAKLVAGVASTLFFGILLCPEVNFRIHLKLGLAVDNFSVKKQKELQTKLKAEMHAKEIAEARAARFAAFEAQRDAKWAADREEQAIDARLADLILNKACCAT